MMVKWLQRVLLDCVCKYCAHMAIRWDGYCLFLYDYLTMYSNVLVCV